jgi:hypothetical protein
MAENGDTIGDEGHPTQGQGVGLSGGETLRETERDISEDIGVDEPVTDTNVLGAAEAGAAGNTLSPFDGKLDPDVHAGRNNTNLNERLPKYAKAECETKYEGKNNTFIILGRDRSQGVDSGYGGKGHTRAGAIDIVVGVQGWDPSGKTAQKSFGTMTNDVGDAARIYISQRADIDKYFGICTGFVGDSIADSAIGIKADSVRIMARKGIKIVTGQSPQLKTSLNGEIPLQYGIDLIAGNRDYNIQTKSGKDLPLTNSQIFLQPIPKGYNLLDCLGDLLEAISLLITTFQDFAGRQTIINALLTLVPGVGGGIAGPPEVNPVTQEFIKKQQAKIFSGVIGSLAAQNIFLGTLETNYLNPASAVYINSKHNRTN